MAATTLTNSGKGEENDTLAAQIAALEAEIQGIAHTDSSSRPELERPPLKNFAPQRDYVVLDGSFAIPDSALVQSSSLLSYDEVTVNTNDMAGGGKTPSTMSLLGPPGSRPSSLRQNPANVMYPVNAHSATPYEKCDSGPLGKFLGATSGSQRRNPSSTLSSKDKHELGRLPKKENEASAETQQTKKRIVKKKVSVRKVKKKKSVRLDDEAARLQAEIDKMEADLLAVEGSTPASPPQLQSSFDDAEGESLDAEGESLEKASNDTCVPTHDQAPLQPNPPEHHASEQLCDTLEAPIQDSAELNEMKKLEAEIMKIQNEIGVDGGSNKQLSQAPEAAETAKPAPLMLGLLGAIQEAATGRNQRLEDGGDRIMQDFIPEVEEKKKGPMQLSTSMAEMISQRAAARDKRLADGGEKRMRKVVIKEKDEYKKEFKDIVAEAASLGRLTRLNEHSVEAVAQEKTKEQEWKSNGLLAIQWRSNHMAVIHEAANMGNISKLPEEIVSNCPSEEQVVDLDNNGQKISERRKQLLQLNSTVGEGQKKVDKLITYLKDEKPAEHLLIKPMEAYKTVEEVKLPKQAPPKVDPKRNAERLSKMKQEALKSGRPMIDISVTVAERAWERRARLDRPGALPKILQKCDCPYCGSASPYQTAAYRQIELARRHGVHQQDAEPSEDERLGEIERKKQERRQQREESRRLKHELSTLNAAINQVKEQTDTHVKSEPQEPEPDKQPAAAAALPVVMESSVLAPESAACCACTIM